MSDRGGFFRVDFEKRKKGLVSSFVIYFGVGFYMCLRFGCCFSSTFCLNLVFIFWVDLEDLIRFCCWNLYPVNPNRRQISESGFS